MKQINVDGETVTLNTAAEAAAKLEERRQRKRAFDMVKHLVAAFDLPVVIMEGKSVNASETDGSEDK